MPTDSNHSHCGGPHPAGSVQGWESSCPYHGQAGVRVLSSPRAFPCLRVVYNTLHETKGGSRLRRDEPASKRDKAVLYQDLLCPQIKSKSKAGSHVCHATGVQALLSVGTGCQSEPIPCCWFGRSCCVAAAVQAFLAWSPRTGALAPQCSGRSGSNASYSTQGQLVTVAEQGFSPAFVRGRVGKWACSWHWKGTWPVWIQWHWKDLWLVGIQMC